MNSIFIPNECETESLRVEAHSTFLIDDTHGLDLSSSPAMNTVRTQKQIGMLKGR
jgi:hypothetical protein